MSTRAAAARRQERQLAATSDSTARVRFEPRGLRQLHPAEYLLRFAFGAGVSVVAGLILLKFGPRLGGVFLAFPAILPASLTLLDQRHGNRPARADAVGPHWEPWPSSPSPSPPISPWATGSACSAWPRRSPPGCWWR